MRASKAGTEQTDTPDGFVALNPAKRSIAGDARTSEGAQLVRALAAMADI